MTHASGDSPESLHSSARHRNHKQPPDFPTGVAKSQASFPSNSGHGSRRSSPPASAKAQGISEIRITTIPRQKDTGVSIALAGVSMVLPVSIAAYLLTGATNTMGSEATDWPLSFMALTEADKKLRRPILDRYANYTLLATLLLILGIGLARFAARTVWQTQKMVGRNTNSASSHRENYYLLGGPTSPKIESGSLTGWRLRLSKVQWWLGGDITISGQNWGQRDIWVGGALWSAILAFLSVYETQGDYLHLTKRLGVVAVGQMPLQYVLTLKYLNPVAHILGTSHEELNRWHRLLGRIVYGWMALHAVFYTNFFYWAGTMSTKPFTFVVLMGEIAFFAMCALASSSTLKVRRRSYRLFFLLHVVASMVVPPMVFLHADNAGPVRIHCIISIAILILDIIIRRIFTIKAMCTITTISDNSLVKIVADVGAKARYFSQSPASHVYLNVPIGARDIKAPIMSPKNLQYESIFNPFTVAATDVSSGEITLIARIMNGPLTQRLASLAAPPLTESSTQGPALYKTQVPLCFDGPHGAASRSLRRLVGADIDRVLLVAGGVGASFIVPVYRAILTYKPNTQIEFVWAVREVGETQWAIGGPQLMLDNLKIRIYVTGDDSDALPIGTRTPLIAVSSGSSTGNILQRDSSASENHSMPVYTRTRPNLVKTVDDFFKASPNDRVAIWVCGPEQMAKDLRACVTPWVMDGRHVEWHNEGFGW
ncbi:putative metalloreductase AIM14 [Ceratocystis fimbriata CBS 114723]|uniref:Putative metalloreductase AIM14 n=1 Tax=Ceratocystis fimbriata CBS 114723 TaxID=1035309 RepID=A0A2C5X366_9PEZI|nr:putative metalloreductase AIM14 [Ceratocystis fimbriata CBS 114723]